MQIAYWACLRHQTSEKSFRDRYKYLERVIAEYGRNFYKGSKLRSSPKKSIWKYCKISGKTLENELEEKKFTWAPTKLIDPYDLYNEQTDFIRSRYDNSYKVSYK